jgi:hypothetical protein
MDVVRITPTNGSNTVTVLGDGKALKKNDWYGRNDIGTDSGHFAYPDPTGGFTGASGRVVVNSKCYRDYAYINSDYNADGDITNDNTAIGTGDYLARTTTAYYGWDAEIFNNRMYVSQSYTGHRPNPNGLDTAGIYYYEQTGTPSAPVLNTRVWWDDNLTAYKNPYWVKGGATGPLAATKVHGIPTTWVLIRDTVGTNAYSIAMMQDLNGNGQAMDNAQVTGTRNEYKIIYDAGDVTGFPGITETLDNPGAGWKDMELIRSADNTMFLFISNTASNWKYGMSVIVLQLDDNGDYTGGDSNAKLVYYAGVNGAGGSLPSTGFLIGTAMEFDATVSAIPEPATMLLLGTGVVAVSGFLRRRRLK